MAILFYLSKTIFPVGLLPIYPRWPVDPPSLLQFLPWPVIGALLLWLWTKRKTWGRHALFGVGFFLITLIPILGFVTMSYMRITWVADHFIYLPAIGILGLMTVCAGQLYDRSTVRSRPWWLAGGLSIFALLVTGGHRYAEVFANETSMWTYTLASNPDAWQAHSRYGKVLMDKGDMDAAFYHISESVRLRPDLAETHNNYGTMLERKGQMERAENEMRKACSLAPDTPVYQVNLATLLIRVQQYDKALGIYRELLAKYPNNPTFLCNYGVALYFLGRDDDAIASFKEALKIAPNLKDVQSDIDVVLKSRAQRAATGTSLANSGSSKPATPAPKPLDPVFLEH